MENALIKDSLQLSNFFVTLGVRSKYPEIGEHVQLRINCTYLHVSSHAWFPLIFFKLFVHVTDSKYPVSLTYI